MRGPRRHGETPISVEFYAGEPLSNSTR